VKAATASTKTAKRKATAATREVPAWLDQLPVGTAERIAKKFGTPVYSYSADVIRARCAELKSAYPRADVRYAMKANACPAVLDIVRDAGVGIDTVSPWEVRLARSRGFRKRDIIYSGNNPSTDELIALHKSGVTMNVDALSALERLGKRTKGGRVALRMNLEVGAGHHKHVVTAGPESKFGLSRDDLPAAREIAARYKLAIIGVHQHIGSGLGDLAIYKRAMEPLFELAETFPELEFVDVGGGFGVPYRPEEARLDLASWGAAMTARFETLEKKVGRKLRLIIEPGRYVVAESGILLTRVTTVKRTHDRTFVGVDTGMHHLVRPAMYESFHPIRSLAPRDGKLERCFVVGPICESGDVLAEDRQMVAPEEGDLLAIGCAGAYGYSMSSHYNLRPRPAEVVIEGSKISLARKRESYREVVE
jgi:diaminopimelate decarboxylase